MQLKGVFFIILIYIVGKNDLLLKNETRQNKVDLNNILEHTIWVLHLDDTLDHGIINSSIIYIAYLLRVTGRLKPIPVDFGQGQG